MTKLLAGIILCMSMLRTSEAEQPLKTVTLPDFGRESRSAIGPVLRASAVGAALNSNQLGGGGTDDTAALQAVLDQASEGRPVHLLIDGVALVGGLNVYGNTTIECVQGGGLYLKDGSSRAIIRNAHRSRGSITDKHITVRGCFLNGNRDHQTGIPGQPYVNSGQPNQEPDGTFITGLQFFGVSYLTIENVILWNIRSFGAWVSHGEYIHFGNVVVDNGSPEGLTYQEQVRIVGKYINTDGIHFTGPIRYLTINGVKLRTGDDALAFDANDMAHDDMTVSNDMGPYVGQGPITDVTVTNVVLVDALLGIRLLSSSQRIDRVVIDNVVGTVRGRMAILGHSIIPTYTGNFGSITFSNISVNAMRYPSFEEWKKESSGPSREFIEQHRMEFADELEYPLFSLNSPIENLNLRDIVTNVIDGRPLIRVGADCDIKTMTIDITANDPTMQSVPLQLEVGGVVERLNFLLDWKTDAVDSGKRFILYNGGLLKQLHWLNTPPKYTSAELTETGAPVITVTFSQSVKSADFKKGVTVRVNGEPTALLSGLLQPSGDAVRYQIGRCVHRGDSVTWAYDTVGGSIQNWDGDNMLSVAPKPVDVLQSPISRPCVRGGR